MVRSTFGHFLKYVASLFSLSSGGQASAYNVGNQVRSLGGEDPLEKEMAPHSSTLAWKIPWRSLVGYSPWGRKESDTTEPLHFTSCCTHPWQGRELHSLCMCSGENTNIKKAGLSLKGSFPRFRQRDLGWQENSLCSCGWRLIQRSVRCYLWQTVSTEGSRVVYEHSQTSPFTQHGAGHRLGKLREGGIPEVQFNPRSNLLLNSRYISCVI